MGRLLLRLLVAAGLAVDAVVHWHLASGFDPVVGSGSPRVTMGDLFRVEAVLAAVALVLVLLVRRRWSAVLAFLVAAGGLVAVLVYSYADPGALGPLPDMHDPTWTTEKILSAVSQAVATVAALGLMAPARTPLPDVDQPAAARDGSSARFASTRTEGSVRTAPAGPHDPPAAPGEPLNPA